LGTRRGLGGVGDYRRAYGIAVRNSLVDPDDTDGLVQLLRCSHRWARDLTKEARDKAELERNAEIVAAGKRGEPIAQTASCLGVHEATVSRIQRAVAEQEREAEQLAERQAARMQVAPPAQQAEPTPSRPAEPLPAAEAEAPAASQPVPAKAPTPPPSVEPEADEPAEPEVEHEPVSVAAAAQQAKPRVIDTETPPALAWHRVLQALRTINDLRCAQRRQQPTSCSRRTGP
jgi:hypothetical protein